MQQDNNTDLKKKLSHIRTWAQKDVQNAREDITLGTSQKDTHNFFLQNIESIIEDKIHQFFPPNVLMNFPADGIPQILSSELIYYNIIKGAHIDGISVVIGYQKVFENMIELYVTDDFRKFVRKIGTINAPDGHHLEKSLYNVVEKNYIISLGRLYEIIKILQNTDEILGKYMVYFKEFLESRPSLQKSLQNKEFFIQLESLVEMQVFGYKRHAGYISEDETKSVRSLFVGDFKSQDCLIYRLAASQDIIG